MFIHISLNKFKQNFKMITKGGGKGVSHTKKFWKTEIESITDLDTKISYYGNELKNALDLEIANLDADASKFFKAVHLQQYRNGVGFLDKE